MEIAFSEKISPQLSAALLSTPYELGKEGGLSSGYLPESDSWEVIVKYVGDIEKIKEKYPSVLITRLLGNYAAVSYTHLDVYKRQEIVSVLSG